MTRKVRCLVTEADVREGFVYSVLKSTLQGVKVIDDVCEHYLLVGNEFEDVPADTPLGCPNQSIRQELKELLKQNLSISIRRDYQYHGDSYDIDLLFEGEVISTSSVTIDESKP